MYRAIFAGVLKHAAPHQAFKNDAQGTDDGQVKSRVLIISYHFPPLNVISSFRAEGFAKYLPEHEIEPTVLTLNWEPSNERGAPSSGTNRYLWHTKDEPISYEKGRGYKVIRLPRIRAWYQVLIDHIMRIPMISTVVGSIAFALGKFNIHILYSHLMFKQFLKEHLQKEKYDVVIAMMSPDEHIALARWIKHRWGIPFIADYRDTYDNRILDSDFDPDLATRIKLWFKNRYHRRWMTNCDLLVSVSDVLVQKLSQVTGMNKTLEIRNGYDPEKILANEKYIDRENFRITFGGRLYPDHDIRPFAKAMHRFSAALSAEDKKRIRVQFFGIQDSIHAQDLDRLLPDVARSISIQRIPTAQIYERYAESCILLMIDIRRPGGYSGKFMDYVGCHRNILMIPSDNGVIADLMAQGDLGLATNDPEAGAQFLLQRFNEWKVAGTSRFEGIDEVIRATSRREQVARLAQAIKLIVAKAQRAPGGNGIG